MAAGSAQFKPWWFGTCSVSVSHHSSAAYIASLCSSGFTNRVSSTAVIRYKTTAFLHPHHLVGMVTIPAIDLSGDCSKRPHLPSLASGSVIAEPISAMSGHKEHKRLCRLNVVN